MTRFELLRAAATLVATTLVTGVTLPASALAPAASTTPARFQVGAAVTDLTPAPGVPVYSGGFGQSPALYAANTLPGDQLTARAIYIANRDHAVVMVEVDSQGIFAAVQQASADPATSGLGSAGMRADAAAAVTAARTGPALRAQDIIVQGSHSHSAPTVMGLWGPVAPEYLQEVHDRVVAAITRAAAVAAPARLEFGAVDAPYIDNVLTNQTDSYQGWAQDGQVSVLRAIDARTGATIVTYANVPAHPDIVNGAGDKVLSADYYGSSRALLETALGGTAIVAPATLGREETPIQVAGVAQMQAFGVTIAELVERSLARARPVTDPTIASAETFIQVPGTNPLLLALVAAWGAPDPVAAAAGNFSYPADRANTPPYQAGNVIGTPLTALRVGKLAYVSLNGEAFPEVRHAIAASISDADMIVGLSLGNDQLGYYSPSPQFAFMNGMAPYHSDHLQYNVSPTLGDEVVQFQVRNLEGIGFSGPALATYPQEPNDYQAMLHPGVQGLASPFRGDAGPDGTFTTRLEGIYGNAALPDSAGQGSGIKGPIHWSFGDGTSADTPVHGRHTGWFSHRFPRPGVYTVRLSAVDGNGDTATWSMQVVAYPALHAAIRQSPGRRGARTFTAATGGGEGDVLVYRWSFSDGTVDYGRTVTHVFAPGARPAATLTVVDGAGGVASAHWS